MSNQQSDLVGRTVSHYRISGPLGSGGMGVVYEASDDRLGRSVAVKFVPEDLAKDPQALDRLRLEARTASGLSHPNICTIHDIGEYGGQPFIVMELLKGRTLRDRLIEGPFRVPEAIDLGMQISDALDAAHQRNIIHRDIKPANIFLVDRGPVKVLDFGLAKLVAQGGAHTTAGIGREHTEKGVTLGTVAYMSPEQVTGDSLDPRTDLFSLGVVLYECLTGHQPFTGKTSAVVFSAILTRAPTAPVVLNPEIPPRLQEVINNCLEKDREMRYQDAAGLRADLKRIKRDLESGRSGVFQTSQAVTTAIPIASGTSRRQGPSDHGAAAETRRAGGMPSQPYPAPTARATAPIAAAVAIVAVLAGLAFMVWSRTRTSPAAPAPTAAAADEAAMRRLLGLATTSLEARDYRAAIGFADEVLRADSNNRDARRIRDAASSVIRRFDDAIAVSRARLAAGDTDGASQALETARSIDAAAPAVIELSGQLVGQLRLQAENARRGLRQGGPPPPPTPTAQTPRVQPPAGRGATQTPSAAPQPATPPPAVVAPPPAVPPAPQPEAAARPAPPPPAPEPPARPAPAPAITPPPSAPPAEAPARSGETDEAAIRRLVASYGRAIETKDIGLFRSVKPNLTAEEQRRIEEGFRVASSQQVNISIVSIEMRGQEASVRVRRRDTVRVGGRQQTADSQQTITVVRSGAGWVIREIRQ